MQETVKQAVQEARLATEKASKAVAKTAELVRNISKTTGRRFKFEVFRDRKKEYRWRLIASNGRIVADSGEGYKRKSDCLHGIDLVSKVQIGIKVKDST